MRELLIGSLEAAMVALKDQADLVGLENVDESTFRSFAMAAIRRRSANSRIQAEWNRVDLFVSVGDVIAAVEFKFYVHRPHYDLAGKLVRWKGGAGPKNSGEFQACLENMHNLEYSGIQNRYVVLLFENDVDHDRATSSATHILT